MKSKTKQLLKQLVSAAKADGVFLNDLQDQIASEMTGVCNIAIQEKLEDYEQHLEGAHCAFVALAKAKPTGKELKAAYEIIGDATASASAHAVRLYRALNLGTAEEFKEASPYLSFRNLPKRR